MPCIAQRSIRTSAPLAGCAGSGPVTGVCAGMDRAPPPSIVTPSSVDPHWPTRLRLPVPRDPGITLGRDGPLPWHPEVSPGGLLPHVCAGDPDVRGSRLARHRLHRHRRWWRGSLDGGRPHVAAAHDQERQEQQQKVSGNPTSSCSSPLAARVWSRARGSPLPRRPLAASGRHVGCEEALSKAHATRPRGVTPARVLNGA
jgi:hypothetical protein